MTSTHSHTLTIKWEQHNIGAQGKREQSRMTKHIFWQWKASYSSTPHQGFNFWWYKTWHRKAIWRAIKVHKRDVEAKQIKGGDTETALPWIGFGIATDVHVSEKHRSSRMSPLLHLGDWNLPAPVTLGWLRNMAMIPTNFAFLVMKKNTDLKTKWQNAYFDLENDL